MKTYFNPYKKFTGVFIPDWLLQSECCSLNAKLVYALLCKYAGENGSCYPKQSTLAEKLKTSRRSIVNYINELVECELIERNRTIQNNTYLFLVHPDMQMQSEESAHTKVNGASHTKVNGASHTYKESHNKESHNNYVQFVDLWNDVNDCNLRITDKKRGQIRARLRTYSEDELKTSIRNRSKDDWINGEGKKYKDNWDSFWRNDEKPERYLKQSEPEFNPAIYEQHYGASNE